MTDDTTQAAIERATKVVCEAHGIHEGGIEWHLNRDDMVVLADAGLLAVPAPAVDREGLANFVANAISRSSQQHVPVGYRVADALITAGQVGGKLSSERFDAARWTAEEEAAKHRTLGSRAFRLITAAAFRAAGIEVTDA